MLHKMRVKLALYFMLLALVLHMLGSSVAIVLLNIDLEHSADAYLADLLDEVRPGIEITAGLPSLKTWVERLEKDRLRILSTIQIYSPDGSLIEHFGPTGIAMLENGRVAMATDVGQLSVRSRYMVIAEDGKQVGYLQVQQNTRAGDQAIHQAISAAFLVMPILAILVALSGYWFASIALEPVEQTMRMLRRFVADAGHELNTPVAVISASLETLTEVAKDSKLQTGELIEIVSTANARMGELASDLVFLARVEDPILAYPLELLKTAPIVEDVARDFQIIASQKHIDVQVVQNDAAEVSGNAEFIRRMLSNLLSNAIRYTDPDGHIQVSSRVSGANLEIAVTDSGIGIPPESLGLVFDRFYRVDKARSRVEGGAGLGLSIVKAVVEAHKGSVTVTSELGKGTTFKVLIPLWRRPKRIS